jgi:hypothetical protein
VDPTVPGDRGADEDHALRVRVHHALGRLSRATGGALTCVSRNTVEDPAVPSDSLIATPQQILGPPLLG